MNIGAVSNPRQWKRWNEAEALLEPARVMGCEPETLGWNEVLWAVLDGDDLLAAATARLTEDKDCEVILVGGRDHRRWIRELDSMIGAAAREAGATRLTAYGRLGWAKSLKAIGWDQLGVNGKRAMFAREL